jgi:hypothetical protein
MLRLKCVFRQLSNELWQGPAKDVLQNTCTSTMQTGSAMTRITTLLMALIAIGSSCLPRGQVKGDALLCDAWLAAISRGDTMPDSRDALYRLDGCERPDRVKIVAREKGVRALIARGEIGWASLHLAYLERDSTWAANQYLPFVLPIIADKGATTRLRGQMMVVLANNVLKYDVAVGSVYVVNEDVTPGTRARCTQLMVVHDKGSMDFTAVQLARIRATAAAMIADESEVAQLREAAHCLLRAAENPSG